MPQKQKPSKFPWIYCSSRVLEDCVQGLGLIPNAENKKKENPNSAVGMDLREMKASTKGGIGRGYCQEQGRGGQVGVRGLYVVRMNLARVICFFNTPAALIK